MDSLAEKVSSISANLSDAVYLQNRNDNFTCRVTQKSEELRSLSSELRDARQQLEDIRVQSKAIIEGYKKKRLEPTTRPEGEHSDKPRNPPASENPDPCPPANQARSEDFSEELKVKALIEAGRSSFEKGLYNEAENSFQEARSCLEHLSSASFKKLKGHEVAYYVAACVVYNQELDETAKKRELAGVVETAENDGSVMLLKLAHAYHLLSQLHIQLGALDKANAYCSTAYSFTSTVSKDDPRHYEPIALWIRICQLQGKGTTTIDPLAKQFPERWRAWFQTRYSYLWPVGTEEVTSNPPRPETPEGVEKSATWAVPAAPENPPDPIRPVDKDTRRRWLKEFQLDKVDKAFRDAIIDSNERRVKDLVTVGKMSKKSLHLAALFGEVEIARILIESGRGVDEVCRTAKLGQDAKLRRRQRRADGYNIWVTPMHLAIGAQQQGMIRLLAQYRARLGIPSTNKREDPERRATAPPRWLLGKEVLRLIECREAQDVIQTVVSLTNVQWNINDGLDHEGRTMLDFAHELEDDRFGFKSAVISRLQDLGAREGRK
jgi:tetratricopeptide (TPR) repeat protein